MKEYIVFFVARTDDGILFDQVDQLSDALIDVDGIIGTAPARLEVAMTVTASRAEAALFDGADRWGKALASVGLAHLETVSAAAVDADYVDSDGPQPAIPELVGIREIADIGHLSPQRASGLARSGAFPAPIADLKSGPVFSREAVERFFAQWERKPGRPRKVRA